MSSQGQKRPAEESSDSEWEYEYHATETESFFVTLALSSAPSIRPKRKYKRSKHHQAAKVTPSTAIDASSQTADRPHTQDGPPEADAAQATSPSTAEPEDRIQILELHSREPIVSFQNQIYACEWTSALGTDLLLTAPDPSPPVPPLYEAPGFHVLAIPRIKLVGRPVDLIRRVDGEEVPESPPPSPAPIQPAIAVDTTPAPPSTTPSPAKPRSGIETAAHPQPPPPARVPVPATSSRVRQKQGRFLERLSAAKLARGEQDSVLLNARRRPPGKGWKTWEKRSRDYGTGEEARALREGALGLDMQYGGRHGSQPERASDEPHPGNLLGGDASQVAPAQLAERPEDTGQEAELVDPSISPREDTTMMEASP
ncbi:hypothetical protein MMC13_006547 [Lambiella insularis]|nr:hypothetical protein [Lambiella insularis]